MTRLIDVYLGREKGNKSCWSNLIRMYLNTLKTRTWVMIRSYIIRNVHDLSFVLKQVRPIKISKLFSLDSGSEEGSRYYYCHQISIYTEYSLYVSLVMFMNILNQAEPKVVSQLYYLVLFKLSVSCILWKWAKYSFFVQNKHLWDYILYLTHMCNLKMEVKVKLLFV